MLLKLSLKNIKKSLKDYAIYFFTLIVGVSIFYVFNAIESQAIMMNVTSNTLEIIKLMTSMLSAVSVFVSFVLGFLIIFASSFLMKRRNKEFALYLILGMGKRKVSSILFIETLMVGLLSLGAGLILGVCLSQLMSILVANMFEADMTRFAFVFSGSACMKTIIYFGIMYLFVIAFNTISIGRCKLIDLLLAERKTEQIKLKNPWICLIIFLISATVLGFAYYLVTARFYELTDDKIILPIALGMVSTFFIFWSLSGLLLKIASSIKSLYYRGLNSFVLRQTASKVNTTVFSMTVICLMLFVTICVLSSALCIKNSMSANLNELAPADMELKKRMNLDESWLEKGYNQSQIENSNYTILELFEKIDFDLSSYLKNSVSILTYKDKDLTLGATLGSKFDSFSKQYLFLNYDTPEIIIKISDYNRAAEFYGNETYSLKENEYIVIADFDSMVQIRNAALSAGEKITVFGHELSPKYGECQDGILDMSSSHINTGIILVADGLPTDDAVAYNYLIANYTGNTRQEKQKIDDMLASLDENPLAETYLFPSRTTKLKISENSIGLSAMITFIGLYLGIIFLISSAAILALKELSESADNALRYHVLRKLGADEKTLNHALFSQIGIFFGFPLLLAIIHSVFGIKFSSFILETFGNEELLPSIIMTAIILVVIYGGYFLITYLCSKNIIRER